MLKVELLDVCKRFGIKCLPTDKKTLLEKKIKEHLSNVLLSKRKQKGKGTTGIEKCQQRDYVFSKIIGSGAFGTIYVACKIPSQSSDGCPYVAKVQIIRKGYEGYDDEIKIYNVIGYQNSVAPTLYDHWECTISGVNYGVMILERMDGDMHSLIKKKNPDEKELGIWLVDILKKLQTFSNLKIIHTDMKPPNILYREIGKDKYEFFLSDFGWAHQYTKNLNDHTKFYDLWKVPETFKESFDIVCLIFFISKYYLKNPTDILESLNKNTKFIKDVYEKIYEDLISMFNECFGYSDISREYLDLLTFDLSLKKTPEKLVLKKSPKKSAIMKSASSSSSKSSVDSFSPFIMMKKTPSKNSISPIMMSKSSSRKSSKRSSASSISSFEDLF